MSQGYTKHIEEIRFGQLSCFKVTFRAETGQSPEDSVIISCPMDFVTKDGKLYALPHDNNMCVISDEYRFLNIHHKNDEENTLRAKARGLRLFNCFKAINNIPDDLITSGMADKLFSFLSCSDSDIKFLSSRGPASINNDLAVIRAYLEYVGKKCPALEEMELVFVKKRIEDQEVVKQEKRYKLRAKEDPHADDYVPDHIKPEEYALLQKLAGEAEDNQMVIILSLMYIYLLRIGEVLSITQEDITFIEVSGSMTPVILLCKRIGTVSWASPKNLHAPKNAKDYGTERHKMRIIPITMEFYSELSRFVNSELSEAKRKFPESFKTFEVDICDPEKFDNETNHYIFYNHTNGGRLNNQALYRKLRPLFISAGLPIDCVVRKLGLAHRIRHGGAMLYHVYIEERLRLPLEKIRVMLGHKNISTTSIYAHETLEGAVQLREQFQGRLFDNSPYLKF